MCPGHKERNNMTDQQIEQLRKQLDTVSDRLAGVQSQLEDIEFSDTEFTMMDEATALDIDDGDVDDWCQQLADCQELLENAINTLAATL